MESKYIYANGLKLAYIEKNEQAEQTIFFIHGNSSSSGVWRKQFESELLRTYRVVAIDLPSHGKSDEMDANADFSLPAIARIAGEVVKNLAGTKPHIICGLSLGTNIVAEMVAPELSPAGLLLAGPCLIGRDFGMDKMILEGADFSAVFAEGIPTAMVNKYARESSLSTDIKDREHFLADYYAVKGKFRSSLYATIEKGLFSDEIELLRKDNYSVCLLFGQDEKLINNKYLDGAPINLWNKSINKIPAASHLVNIDSPGAFNELLAKFAQEMFTGDAV
jgi:pimeloyl-ACP methyl ester carboxylesterase